MNPPPAATITHSSSSGRAAAGLGTGGLQPPSKNLASNSLYKNFNDVHAADGYISRRTTTTSTSETEDNLANQLAGLDLAELDDPIEPYLTCFHQLEIQYPFPTQLPLLPATATVLDALAFADLTNTPHSYARALRACLDRFSSAAYPYYRNDPRYLGVWLTYLRRCVPPAAHGRVYRYLYTQAIGTTLARFYESYAEWLFHQADPAAMGSARRVLEIGLQHGARPVQRLEKMYRLVAPQAGHDYNLHAFDHVLPQLPARREHIAVALPHLRDDIYEEDYCLEEVLAKSRDILYKTYHRPAPGDSGFSTIITEDGKMVTTVVATPRRKKSKKSLSLSSTVGTRKIQSYDERAANAPAVVIFDAVCDPTSSDHKRTILAARHTVLSGATHVHDASTTRLGNHVALRKAFKRANGHGHTHGFLLSLPCGGRGARTTNIQFMARKFLGEGGFGAVYLAEPLTERGKSTGQQVALKVEDDPNAWEPYILTLLQQRLAGPGFRAQRRALEQHVVRLYGAHLFRDASCLALEYLPQGTVLDAVNAARRDAGTALLDEVVVVFFVVQLLRAVEALHTARIIHGDIKPDNVMLQLDPVDEEGGEVWDRYYRAPTDNGSGGSPGWAQKRLKLIDFGRAIDLSAYRPDVEFSAAGWAGSMDQQDCVEMREGRTWTYQADYHGVAGVIHCMLFGRFIQTTARKTPKAKTGETVYSISTPYKRYWQQHMWADLFHTLLNSASVAAASASASSSSGSDNTRADGMPITYELARLRGTFERWLETNCEAGTNSLKTAVRKLELALTKTAGTQSGHTRKK